MEPTKNRKNQPYHHTDFDRLFRYAEFLGFGDVHVKFDHATGLRAIVAIHNLKRGPAIGGARLIHYATTDEAFEDVLRLAEVMSLKAAISNLPHGGAKAVLIKPKIIKDRKAYLEAFGEFVQMLGGRYITAPDSGTGPEDMDIIFSKTPFVTCTTDSKHKGDSSLPTAHGILRGIEAAVQFKLNKNNLSGVHVAIQGAGHVGYHLAKHLHERGATLTICDTNLQAAQRCVDEFRADVVSVDKIYDVPADVFSPCALGAILNLQNIKRIKAPIVAGSANNQLAHHHNGVIMHELGILYAPDFVINAGGLIFAASAYKHDSGQVAEKQIDTIYQTLIEIFERAQKENLSTNEIAEKMAEERLK